MSASFYLDKLDVLVGGQIRSLVLSTSDDDEVFVGLRVSCRDGKQREIIFLRDDEGNGPGSFYIDLVHPE